MMSEKKKNASEKYFNRQFRRAEIVRGLFKIALLGLLFQSPLHATDPTEIDPDPDYLSSSTSVSEPTILIVPSLDSLDIDGLRPGHYVIIVVGENENGAGRRFEIYIQ